MAYMTAIIAGYLIGCSNMAFYISRLKSVDLQHNGSGNLGASNTTILLGWNAGVAVGLHDIGKAILAVLLVQWWFPQAKLAGLIAGLSCVMGHMFPFYLRFRGGKGLASYIGMTLALNWKLALGVIVAVVLVTLITDRIVFGTFTAITVVPVYSLLTTRQWLPTLLLAVTTLVMLCKHQDNIERLRSGKEVGLRSTLRGEYRMK